MQNFLDKRYSPHKPRLLYFAARVSPSSLGSTTHVSEIIANLSDLGYSVYVVRGLPSWERVEDIYRQRKKPFRVLSETMRIVIHLFLFFASIMKLTQKGVVDLIYVRGSPEDASATLVGLLLCRPVVLEVNDATRSSFSLKFSDKVITTSRVLTANIADDRVIQTTWGGNVHIFTPEVKGGVVRKRLGIEGNPIVVYTGGFYRWHALDDLIDASKEVVAREPSVRFLLVGDGPEFRRVLEIIRKERLSEFFILTGRIPYREVPSYIAASDVAVALYDPKLDPDVQVLPRKEFFRTPIKIFEYMAMGKPIVTVDVANIRDVMQNHRNGLLVPPGDTKKLAEGILSILGDAQLARRLGRQARRDVEVKFSWEKHAELLDRVFKDTIKDKAPGARRHSILTISTDLIRCSIADFIQYRRFMAIARKLNV